MSIKKCYYNFISSGYYGQKPTKSDNAEKSCSISQKPETYTEKWKRHSWTALPYLPFILPAMTSIAMTISNIFACKITIARGRPALSRCAYHGFRIAYDAVALAFSLCFAKFIGIPHLKEFFPYVYGVRAIWAFQGKKVYYQSLDNYFQRKLGLQSQEIVPISLIDPREPIKQLMTSYETKIKKLCGEHFLYFKRNGPQEKFLILTAEADYNGFFEPFLPDACLIYQLSKRFDVKYRTISCVEDIQKEIQNATQFGRVMGLIIAAHGSRSGMNLSNDNRKTNELHTQTISADLFSGLDPQCVIALKSCNTASDPDSIAYRVAGVAQRTTYAPSNPAYCMILTSLDPLEFSFERPFCRAITKKLQPFNQQPGRVDG